MLSEVIAELQGRFERHESQCNIYCTKSCLFLRDNDFYNAKNALYDYCYSYYDDDDYQSWLHFNEGDFDGGLDALIQEWKMPENSELALCRKSGRKSRIALIAAKESRKKKQTLRMVQRTSIKLPKTPKNYRIQQQIARFDKKQKTYRKEQRKMTE